MNTETEQLQEEQETEQKLTPVEFVKLLRINPKLLGSYLLLRLRASAFSYIKTHRKRLIALVLFLAAMGIFDYLY